MGAAKTENRGGAREGAGRPKETLSVRQIREFEEAAKALAKEFGYTLPEGLGRMFYDESAPRRDRLAAAKLFLDKSMVPITEGGDADKNLGPAMYLPEKRPALEVVKGAK